MNQKRPINIQLESLLKVDCAILSIGAVTLLALVIAIGAAVWSQVKGSEQAPPSTAQQQTPRLNPHMIPLSQVLEHVNESEDIDALIFRMNMAYAGSPVYQTGSWLRPGIEDREVLTGPIVFWADLGADADLPACLGRFKTEGNWGVFRLPLGCQLRLSTASPGGRWISLEESQ